ncbi:MAG: ribonuclease D [Holosporales bacterium]|jgi:ribonuclease D|nr:ribonuclease D [Holosporales bacterium]
MKVILHKNDIPAEFLKKTVSVAVDTETMGLNPYRDRLCLVQLSKGDGVCHLVQMESFNKSKNLKDLLENNKILKIFHYARFDMMMLYKYLGVMTKNIYCTKIASKLARTYTDRHNLKGLCEDLLKVEITKAQTCTDWGAQNLTKEQKEYAATDVLHLHDLKRELDVILVREQRQNIAQKCFDFLEIRVIFDLMCGEMYDIFSHG